MEKEVTIKIEVRELLHDIRNKTYLTKAARSVAGLSPEAASDMQADESGADKYQLGRALAHAFEGVKNVVSEYLEEGEESGTNQIKKEIDNEGQLTLDLMMPDNFDKNAIGLLTESVHAYMVTTALAEWFIVKNPNEAQYYIKEIPGCISAIRVAIYKRNRPERPNCDY